MVPLCRLLEVSRSGYYAARWRTTRPATICAVTVPLAAAFAASGRSDGSGRLSAALQSQGVKVGWHRVRTHSRNHGLRPIWKRKFIPTTDSRHALPIVDNRLDRRFEPGTANVAWVSDLTSIRTR